MEIIKDKEKFLKEVNRLVNLTKNHTIENKLREYYFDYDKNMFFPFKKSNKKGKNLNQIKEENKRDLINTVINRILSEKKVNKEIIKEFVPYIDKEIMHLFEREKNKERGEQEQNFIYENLNKKDLEEFEELIDSDLLIEKEKLTKKFIKNHKEELNWSKICEYQNLSQSFIEEFQDYVVWDNISSFQNLSEDFINKYSDFLNWDSLSRKQKLSEDFIQNNQNKVHWGLISEFQELSEEFLIKFQHKIYWNIISECQNLSETFINNFNQLITWETALLYQNLSDDFVNKYQYILSYNVSHTSSATEKDRAKEMEKKKILHENNLGINFIPEEDQDHLQQPQQRNPLKKDPEKTKTIFEGTFFNENKPNKNGKIYNKKEFENHLSNKGIRKGSKIKRSMKNWMSKFKNYFKER